MSEFITIDTSIQKQTKIVYEPYKLVSEDDLILKKVASPFDFSRGIDVVEVVQRMVETAKLHRGFGLAAPQCGLDYRIFVFGAEESYYVMINPEIIERSDEVVNLAEGCLSFPFLYLSIKRPKFVVVRFQDENATVHKVKFDGITARIIQHEIDHLNGLTFDVLAKPLALKQGMKRREKQMKQFAKQIAKRTVIKK